jgi:protein-S-isoprenylcysteine O-methyltransferase Ste14
VVSSGAAGVLGASLCVVALGFVVLGSAALGRNLSPFPKPKDDGRLVTSGVYAVVRHPLYTGFGAGAFGWSLLWRSVSAAIVAVVLLLWLDLKARREERWLEQKFADYRDYKARVRRLIPFVY